MPPETLCAAVADVAELDDEGYTFLREDGGGEQMPYREFVARARARAGALRDLGLVEGDRIALVLEDNLEFVVTFFAAVLAKIVPVPMYPPLALGRLTGYLDNAVGIVGAAGAAAIATSAQLKPLLWPVAARVASVRHVVTPAQLDARRAAFTAPDVAPDDLAFLQFTSGSTAAPKGVMVTHRCLMANTRAILGDLLAPPTAAGRGPDEPGGDRGLSWLPLYHDMGLIGFVIAPLACRRSVVLMPALSFLKRPERWFQALHDHRATMTFAPNFAYAMVVKRVKPADLARWDLSRVRIFGCGAEPIRADTLRAFADHFAPAGVRADALLPSYGMAEATLAVAFHPPGQPLQVDDVDAEQLRRDGRAVPAGDGPRVTLVGCGRALPEHAVRIVDAHGQVAPERVVGEIEARGPSIAAGYFGDAAATRATFVDGWLRTGDLGYLAGGHLYVSGRKKDLIIVAGRNYAPEQLEAVAATVPEIRPGNVVAFARDGARGTDDVVIVCESRTPEPARLIDAVRARLAEEVGVAVADVVVLAPGALPKTSSGKLQRALTRTRYLERTLDRQGNRSPTGGARVLLLARHLAVSSWSRLRFLWRRA